MPHVILHVIPCMFRLVLTVLVHTLGGPCMRSWRSFCMFLEGLVCVLGGPCVCSWRSCVCSWRFFCMLLRDLVCALGEWDNCFPYNSLSYSSSCTPCRWLMTLIFKLGVNLASSTASQVKMWQVRWQGSLQGINLACGTCRNFTCR